MKRLAKDLEIGDIIEFIEIDDITHWMVRGKACDKNYLDMERISGVGSDWAKSYNHKRDSKEELKYIGNIKDLPEYLL